MEWSSEIEAGRPKACQTKSNHPDIAQQLGISTGAARVAAHRLRKRYRDLLYEEIAQTISDRDEIEVEIRDLFAAFEN